MLANIFSFVVFKFVIFRAFDCAVAFRLYTLAVVLSALDYGLVVGKID